MSQYLLVGQRAATSSSYLVASKTVKGEPVLRLDQDKDRSVSPKDPAVVVRKQDAAGEWKWTPAADPQETMTYLNGSDSSKGDDVGLWTDKKSYLFFAADGVVQDKEVTTFKERWSEEKLDSSNTRWNTEKGQNDGWFNHYSTVDASAVKVRSEERHNGTLTVLEEPGVITRTRAEEVEIWARTGAGWIPYTTEKTDYR